MTLSILLSSSNMYIVIIILLLISIVYGKNLRSESTNEEAINYNYNNSSRSLASSPSSASSTTSAAASYTKRDYSNLPQVFLLGAQKAGTESMFDVLIKHKVLCGSNGKHY
jgi:hypothetical protein